MYRVKKSFILHRVSKHHMIRTIIKLGSPRRVCMFGFLIRLNNTQRIPKQSFVRNSKNSEIYCIRSASKETISGKRPANIKLSNFVNCWSLIKRVLDSYIHEEIKPDTIRFSMIRSLLMSRFTKVASIANM